VERFVVDSRVLWDHPQEAVTLVRLGALANAIGSAMTLTVGSMARGVGAERDLLQAILLITSYFKEAVDTINTRHSWRLIETGVSAGYRLPVPLDEIKKLYSRDAGSLYKRGVFEIRRTKGFHVDEKHFHEWLAQLQTPFVTLWRKESAIKFDWAFTASAQIQSFFGRTMDEVTGLEVARAASHLTFLVEAMACGLLAESGFDPGTAWRRMIPSEIRFEYEFYDKRPPFCDVKIVTIDANGDFTSVVHELRDHVSRVLGGRRAGAMVPGADAPIAFSSDTGTARAWPGRPVRFESPPVDDRAVLLRMRNMARRGAHATKAALTFAHAVRTGRATAEQTDRFIAGLHTDVAYWEEEERQNEEVIAQLRPR